MTRNKDEIVIADHIEIHDRGDDRIDAQSGKVLYINGGDLRTVDNTGTIRKPAEFDQNDTTESVNPGFGTWTTADVDRPSWVDVDATAETDGTSLGKVEIAVDEDDDGTADRTLTVSSVAPDNAAGTAEPGSATGVYVPAGGQYKIVNTDPNGGNTINSVHEITA